MENPVESMYSEEAKVEDEGQIKVVGLTIDHADRVNAFVAAHAFTEPVIKTFQGKEPLEGSVLEASLEHVVTCCLMTGVLENCEPSSLALVQNNELIAVCLGTKEKFPKLWGLREMSAFRGPDATNYFGIMSDMERTMGDKMQGRLKDKKVYIPRIFCVAQSSYAIHIFRVNRNYICKPEVDMLTGSTYVTGSTLYSASICLTTK